MDGSEVAQQKTAVGGNRQMMEEQQMAINRAIGEKTHSLVAVAPRRGAKFMLRRALTGLFTGLLALLLMAPSVLALDPVQDAGNMFSPQARQTATDKITQIQRDAGKTVVVRTVPNLGG